MCRTGGENGVAKFKSTDTASANQKMSIASSRCHKGILTAETESTREYDERAHVLLMKEELVHE